MKSGIEIVEMLEHQFKIVILSEQQKDYLIQLIETALNEAYEQGKNDLYVQARRLSEKR